MSRFQLGGSMKNIVFVLSAFLLVGASSIAKAEQVGDCSVRKTVDRYGGTSFEVRDMDNQVLRVLSNRNQAIDVARQLDVTGQCRQASRHSFCTVRSNYPKTNYRVDHDRCGLVATAKYFEVARDIARNDYRCRTQHCY